MKDEFIEHIEQEQQKYRKKREKDRLKLEEAGEVSYIDKAIDIVRDAYKEIEKASIPVPYAAKDVEIKLEKSPITAFDALLKWGEKAKAQGALFEWDNSILLLSAIYRHWGTTYDFFMMYYDGLSDKEPSPEQAQAKEYCQTLTKIHADTVARLSLTYADTRIAQKSAIISDIEKYTRFMIAEPKSKEFQTSVHTPEALAVTWRSSLQVPLCALYLLEDDTKDIEETLTETLRAYIAGILGEENSEQSFSFDDMYFVDEEQPAESGAASESTEQITIDDYSGAELVPVEDKAEEQDTESGNAKPEDKPAKKKELRASIIPSRIEHPTDKINRNIWSMLGGLPPDGQQRLYQLKINTTSRKLKGKGNDTIVMCSLSFDESEGVHITKNLEPYDKRVFIAIHSLLKEGNKIVSLNDIYKAMGGNGKAQSTTRDKINASIDKMLRGHITIDNSSEIEAGYNYPRVKVDSPLLLVKRVTIQRGGKESDTFLEIVGSSPLMDFAKGRKQIITISRKLLQSPLSTNNTTILLEDYLIEQITDVKNGKRSARILYKSIFDITKTPATKTTRTKDYITRLLDFYVSEKFIKGYDLDKTGISIKY